MNKWLSLFGIVLLMSVISGFFSGFFETAGHPAIADHVESMCDILMGAWMGYIIFRD